MPQRCVRAMGDGATPGLPPLQDGCAARPPCAIWQKIRPPAAWTASTISFHLAVWASSAMQGSRWNVIASLSMDVNSVMTSPADARWT